MKGKNNSEEQSPLKNNILIQQIIQNVQFICQNMNELPLLSELIEK